MATLYRLLSYESLPDEATIGKQMGHLKRNLFDWLRNRPLREETKVYTGEGGGMFKIFIFIPIKDRGESIRWDPEFAKTLKTEMNVESQDNLVLEVIKELEAIKS